MQVCLAGKKESHAKCLNPVCFEYQLINEYVYLCTHYKYAGNTKASTKLSSLVLSLNELWPYLSIKCLYH